MVADMAAVPARYCTRYQVRIILCSASILGLHIFFHEKNDPRFVPDGRLFSNWAAIINAGGADRATGRISDRQGKRASEGIWALHHPPRQLLRRSQQDRRAGTCENTIYFHNNISAASAPVVVQ